MEPEAYTQMAESEATHWWFVARRHILRHQLSALPARHGRKILEIGCGTGGNLEMLMEFGEVSAVEMDPSARRFAAEKVGNRVDILAGSAPDDLPPHSSGFDLICMFDVLEHIERDADTVCAIRDLLAPDGHILITVPAYQWLWSRHDEFLHHKRRYTRRSLKSLLESCGVSALRLTYFNTLLLPLVAAIRLKERLLGAEVPTGHDIPAQSINDMLRRIFASESALLRHSNLPFGVSLMVLAQKRPTYPPR